MLVAIGAVLAITTGFTLGTVAALDHQGTRGIQTELATRAGADLALRASLIVTSNAARQDGQVRAAIDSSFANSHLDVAVTRTLSEHVTVRVVADEEGVDRGGSAQSIPEFETRVDLVDGAIAQKTTEVAVQADAAESLGLATGDEVLIAGVRFTVSGTWRVVDAFDPRWYGDTMVATGYDDDFGPFVIDEAAWSRLDEPPTASWTIVPDVRQIDIANLGPIVDAWAGIRGDWRRTVDGLETLTPQSRLVKTLQEIESRIEGLRALEPVIFTLLAAAALVGLAELVRLLVSTRRRVTALYWARGDSRRGVAGRLATDVGFAALIGAVLGAAAAGAAVSAVFGVDALLSVGLVAGITPLAVLLGAIVIAAVASRQDGFTSVAVARAGARARRVALPGIAVLTVLAAALSVWQLRLYGSPVTPTVDGSGDVDPVAVVAPALALAAAVLVCIVAFPRLAALNERRVSAARVTSQLAARGIVRRAGLVTAPLVLMALAAGSTTIAAAYAATWDAAFTQTAALRAGSDLHATARLDAITPEAQEAIRSIGGVEAAAPLEVQPVSIGGEPASLLGASPEAVARLAVTVEGAFDPAAAAQLLQSDVPGPVLPPAVSGLRVTLVVDGLAAPPTMAMYLASELGDLISLDVDYEGAEPAPGGDQDAGQQLTYSIASLPAAASGGWRIAALDFGFAEQDFESDPADIHLARIEAITGGSAQNVPLDEYWIADAPDLRSAPPATDLEGRTFFMDGQMAGARISPTLDGTGNDRPHPPVLISRQLADTFDLEVGDLLAFDLQDGIERLDYVVAGVVPAVPGAPTESAVLLDLGVIQHYQLRTTATPAPPRDLWVTTEHPGAVVGAIRAALPPSARIDTAADSVGRQILGSAAIAFWAAAACIILLAIVGIASSASARLRIGRNDVAVLRALGLSMRDQARIPSAELRVVLVIGLLAGVAAGAGVSALTVPLFARAAVTLPYFGIGTDLLIDPVAWAVALAVLCAAAAVVILVMGRRVAGLVRTALPGEELE